MIMTQDSKLRQHTIAGRDILYMLVNSSTFASQAKISIFASQMTRISHKKMY
jgi:hypothetical protein